MKYLSRIPSLLFLVLFTFLTVTSQGQNINPRYVSDLNLTDAQKEEMKTIDKDFEEKNKEILKSIRTNELNDLDQADLYKKIKELENEKNDARIKVLTAEQLETYEGYVIEKQAERKSRKLDSQIKKMDNDYPGIDMTAEQNIALYEKLEVLKNIGWENPTPDSNISYDERRIEIYKEVLDERQFALYQQIEKEKKKAKEDELLVEYKKVIPVVEELIPMLEEFSLPKFKTLRNKLEAKISAEDKLAIEQLRAERQVSFDKFLQQTLDEEFDFMDFENPELNRNVEYTKDLMEENADNISILWATDWENFFSNDKSDAMKMTEKYLNEINALEAELLWTTRETIKKGAIIVSKEYPVPPVSIILSEVKEFPVELKMLFLLLDTEVDFSIDLPDFDKGEGDHFASVYPNPAVRNQTLSFFLQQDTHVTVEVLDESGRVVETLASEAMNKGQQKLEVNTNDLNAQLYFYRITTGSEVTMLKFSVVK